MDTMDWNAFGSHLSKQLNQSIQIQSAHRVSGGDIHQAYQLQTSFGNLFLKLNRLDCLPLFETEAHSLNAIHQSTSIRCPLPLGVGTYNHHTPQADIKSWLLMEHLPLTQQGNDFQRGKGLALMHHQINQDTQPFGWFEDNYIGHTLQPNNWHFEWPDFYAKQRLKPQLELAILRGATQTLYEQGMKLIEVLPFWFADYQPKASLLHGDLWGGNSAFIKASHKEQENEAVIFDPASYYGDRETDIAMTELFGGYSAAFYAGYNDVFPLDTGYSSRKPLYNLYHLLNHFNLFGGHYEDQALKVINHLLTTAK